MENQFTWMKKMATFFDLADESKDRLLSKSELINCMSRISEQTLEAREEAKSTIKEFWDFVLDNDDSETDFFDFAWFMKKMWGKLIENADTTKSQDILQAQAEKLFLLIDCDKDGEVCVVEYGRFLDIIGTAPGKAEEAFSNIDRNSDGSMSKEEFKTAYVDFWLNTGEGPGTFLLGPLSELKIDPVKIIFWEEKMIMYFDMVSCNDGKLDKADYFTLLHRFRNQLMGQCDDQSDIVKRFEMAQAYLEKSWKDFILRGAKKRKKYRVTKLRFIRNMRQYITGDNIVQFKKEIMILADMIFDIINLNNDLYLTVKEYELFLHLMGAGNSMAKEAFKQIDLDGSGTLSREEFKGAFVNFWTSVDPGSGMYMLGPIDY